MLLKSVKSKLLGTRQWLLVAVLIISTIGWLTAQTDTLPSVDQPLPFTSEGIDEPLPYISDDSIGTMDLPEFVDDVDTSKLPAIIDGKYVGVTFDQMDYLTIQKFRYEETAAQKIVYEDAYHESLNEIAERDTAIAAFKRLDEVQRGDITILKANNLGLENNVQVLTLDLKKQKRRTVEAWITGGVITGILTGLLISK
jgi:hypothetical protein